MDNFEKLLNDIGRPYHKYNEDGTYQGCFYPVQVLYPDKPRYKLRSENDDKNYFYGLSKIKKHCVEIAKDEIQKGDIIVTRFNDELHIAIYYEFGKIIHVFRNHTLQISRIKIFREYKCYRVV